MYTTMTERHRYREVLYCTSAVVLLTYTVIMVAGYWFFAQYTLSPGNAVQRTLQRACHRVPRICCSGGPF
jgi:hypothetical protein